MHDFHEDISLIKKDKKRIFIWIICFFIFVGILIYINTFFVIVRFDELGPVSKNMVIYYNGFRVGKIVNIRPDKDFKHTLVTVNLTERRLNLPRNTMVEVKNFPSGELFLQFIYPTTPSLIAMRRGDILEGISPYSLEEFMLGQNGTSVTDVVSKHIIQTLNSARLAAHDISHFFRSSSVIIKENRQGLKNSVDNTEQMTRNLAETSENLNQASKKLNSAIDSDSFRESTLNIKDSTKNIKETTENINRATKDLDKTMKKVDETVANANSTAGNLNTITGGLQNTLSKKFGTMRVIFGTPINTNTCKY